jgi:hypothetical protein
MFQPQGLKIPNFWRKNTRFVTHGAYLCDVQPINAWFSSPIFPGTLIFRAWFSSAPL